MTAVKRKLKISGRSSVLSRRTCRKIKPIGRSKARFSFGTIFKIRKTEARRIITLSTNRASSSIVCWPRKTKISNNQWVLTNGKSGFVYEKRLVAGTCFVCQIISPSLICLPRSWSKELSVLKRKENTKKSNRIFTHIQRLYHRSLRDYLRDYCVTSLD